MPINKNIIYTAALVVTVLSAAIFVAKNQQLNKEKEALEKHFSVEKAILETQLDEILVKYDDLKLDYEQVKEEKEALIQNVNKTNAKENTKLRFVSEKTTGGKIYNLKIRNEELEKEIAEIETQIISNKNKIAELKNHPLVEKVAIKELKAVNINARGVRVMSDLYKQDKPNKIQEIRVCFTLEGNEFVGKGHKKIYIQIVNPYNQVVSIDREKIEDEEGNVIKYSSKVNTPYNQKDTDVCAYVDLEKNRTVKGTYQVNLFYDFKKIGSTNYHYN